MDFELLEQMDPSPDPELIATQEAQKSAEDLISPVWYVRRDACRILGQAGRAAKPYLHTLKKLMQTDSDYEVSKAARVALNNLRDAGILADRKPSTALRRELIHALTSQPDETRSHLSSGYRMGFPRPYSEDIETLEDGESDRTAKPVQYWSPAEVGLPWVQVEHPQPKDQRHQQNMGPLLLRVDSNKSALAVDREQSINIQDDNDGSDDTPSFVVLEAQRLANDLLSPDPIARKDGCAGLAEIGEVGENFLPELEIVMTDDSDQGVRREALNAIRALLSAKEKRETMPTTRAAVLQHRTFDLAESDDAPIYCGQSLKTPFLH